MRQRNRAVVLSVQHTGTVFTLKLLQSGTQRKVAYGHLRETDPPLISGCSILQGHVWGRQYPVAKNLKQRQQNTTYSGPVKGDGTVLDRYLAWLADKNDCRVVVPLRDPLLCIISHHARNVVLNPYFHVVDGFTAVLQLEAFFLPVDVQLDCDARVRYVRDLYEWLDWEINDEAIDTAVKWAPPAVSRTGDSKLKRLYRQQDYSRIEKLLPEACAYLQQNRKDLQLSLEAQGYRDLLWWN